MATLLINNTNSPKNMRLRVTYTSGSGNVTISKIEGCRTDGYSTTDGDTCSVKVKLGSVTNTYNKNGIYFNANSSYSTILNQNISFSATGTQVLTITFTSANSNINNSKFTAEINAGIKNPTVTINNAPSDNRLNISTTGCTLNYTLSNTTSISTTLQYYVGTWKNFESKNADGTYNYTITSAQATEIINYFNTTANPNLQLRVTNSTGTSAVVTAYLKIDNSIVPTLDNITVYGYSEIMGFDGLFIKGLSKPVIVFSNASGVAGSTIASYMIGSLTGDSRTNFVLKMDGDTTNTDNFNNFTETGTNTLTAYVKDSRTRNSAIITKTFDVIDYNTPSIVSATIQRCLQDGTLNENGTYGKLNINYKVYPVNDNQVDNNIKNLYYSLDNENWTSINISSKNWEDSVEQVIGGSLSITNTYTIYLKLVDRTSTILQNIILAPAKRLISRYHGYDGEGVTLGQKASGPGFHDYLGANFHNGLKIDGVDVLPRSILSATISSDVTLTNTSDKPITLVNENSVGSKLTVSSGGIVIGSGVTKVLVSGKANFNTLTSSTTQRYFKIKKGGTEILVARNASPNNTTGLAFTITPQLIDVQEGDVFTASVQGVANDVLRSSAVWTYITIEVVA